MEKKYKYANNLAKKMEERFKELGKYIFTNLQANGIVGVSYNPAGIKLALKCGMEITDEKDPYGGVILKMSRDKAEGKWF